MISPRSQLLALIEQGIIPQQNIDEALRAAKFTPDGASWLGFLDRFFLWIGGLCIGAAALFFIAYNWSEIGRFGKFGFIEGCMILAIFFHWRSDASSIRGKVALLVATIFLGVLLALFGQTYQTGADPWQLFCSWALLMTPWAIIGRLPALWIVWIALVNISIFLCCSTYRGTFLFLFDTDVNQLWLPFCCNALALIAWECCATKQPWLAQSWAVRLIAVAVGAPITLLNASNLFERGGGDLLAFLAWVAWLVAMYVVYRKIKPDLFMLAGCCLSAMIVVLSFFSKSLFNHVTMEGFFILALLTVAMGAGAAFWLKNVHREMHA
ncbi:DUF2157 domain-containing protein [uncultured Vibrio sp.]|uniref:DUF2157 domain-containing protein n=1 Tax=uncultured Vibrio sp. TaxID=114054 RepID=UPI002AA746C3|nr:DUF2157 domain-containing protein [uncultured Vibrio sp.]